MDIETGSKQVCSAAIKMAVSLSRDDETKLKEMFRKENIQCCAIDFGGEFVKSINKIIEHTVVAAKREGIITETHREQGALAGAAREAISQISQKAMGLNVGGKIGIARYNEHISVALYFTVGLLHMNEISVGLGHRVI